jgi:hypothetical protein
MERVGVWSRREQGDPLHRGERILGANQLRLTDFLQEMKQLLRFNAQQGIILYDILQERMRSLVPWI